MMGKLWLRKISWWMSGEHIMIRYQIRSLLRSEMVTLMLAKCVGLVKGSQHWNLEVGVAIGKMKRGKSVGTMWAGAVMLKAACACTLSWLYSIYWQPVIPTTNPLIFVLIFSSFIATSLKVVYIHFEHYDWLVLKLTNAITFTGSLMDPQKIY